MMQQCKLVHGDLSEYNMLYYDGKLYIIDVSQSVESDHPQSLDFLKRDCVNVNNFFERRIGRPAVSAKTLFDFITEKELPCPSGAVPSKSSGSGSSPEQEREAFEALLAKSLDGSAEGDDIEEEIFMKTWIPSHLDQVSDRNFIEKELEKRERGEEVLCERLLAGPAGRAAGVDRVEEEEEEEEEDEEEDETHHKEIEATQAGQDSSEGEDGDEEAEKDEEGSDDDDGAKKKLNTDGHIPEGVDKAAWKAQVKAEKAEKRKEKVPKALKKKFKKQAAKGH